MLPVSLVTLNLIGELNHDGISCKTLTEFVNSSGIFDPSKISLCHSRPSAPRKKSSETHLSYFFFRGGVAVAQAKLECQQK